MDMRAIRLFGGLCLFLILLRLPVGAQHNLAGAVQTRLALERLNVLGSVLTIAAHPDDENAALLAYVARGRRARAAYLALTRGDGGQNLIGSEQGELLGLIRTQELLGARRIDGAEQFFTRAIDFGYSKTAEETFEKWGHEKILSDVVWTIRRFRPDVMVIGVSGGHGHHQAAGILAREGFAAAAGKTRFPEQLRYVEPWQTKRLLTLSFGSRGGGGGSRSESGIRLDTGEFDPLIGFSYSELAGMSRSMHKTQGVGSPERRGPAVSSPVVVAGEPATHDIFDGIDTTWNRLPGGAAVTGILKEAADSFVPEQPAKTIPLLLKARPLVAAIKDPWAILKLKELDESIALCAGLWLDASADRSSVVPGAKLEVGIESINRSRFPMALKGVKLEGMAGAPAEEFAPASLAYNQPDRRGLTITIPREQPYSQPYWLQKPNDGFTFNVDDQQMIGLAESPPVLRARIKIQAGSEEIEFIRPVIRRYVDRVEGETTRPLVVVPPVAVNISEPVLIFPEAHAKSVDVLLRGNGSVSGDLRLEAPQGWRVQPATLSFRIPGANQETSLSFTVSPSASAASGELRAVARIDGREVSNDMRVIGYEGIPPQTIFPPSTAKLIRTDARTLARKVGYVMGAGDEVPRALRQLGCEVTMLSADDLAGGDLSRFDAIVTGVRAYNVRTDLAANQPRVLDYVRGGGTLVVQYLRPDGRSSSGAGGFGPYPLSPGGSRVTVEDAPVKLLNPNHPLLNAPNKIGPDDFRGWVQERGLYFASEWDPKYEPLFELNDPGESPQRGATLYARYGKGAYVFTALAWFRQLPAGVPGAYRIFANFLSAGKTAK